MGEWNYVCFFISFLFLFWLIHIDVNRDSIHLPIIVPDSASLTRSPTGSICTILSIDSSSSQSSNGSHSTVFMLPLSTLPDISNFQSNTSTVSCQSSLASSYHTQMMDDMAIQNEEYVYRGDPCVITPSCGNSMRWSGSMTDLDKAFKLAINHARGDRWASVDLVVAMDKDRRFQMNISLALDLMVWGPTYVSSTYFLPTSFTLISGLCTATNLRLDDTMTALTTANSKTQVPTTTFTLSSYRLMESASLRSGDSNISFANSPSTLSRAREIRRRVAHTSLRLYSSGYQMEALQSNSSDKENDKSMSRSQTLTGSFMYTPVSGSTSLSGGRSGSYTEDWSCMPTGSERFWGVGVLVGAAILQEAVFILEILPATVLSRPVLMSSISSSQKLFSFTQTSSYFLPLGPEPWASMTNISYESSILQPSPSVPSIALQEVNVSFKTSFLQPSGSASSVDQMSTIPGSPSPLTSAPPRSPLQPLTPALVLPLSISSSTDIATPTSISLSTVSSSLLGCILLTCSSSFFVSSLSSLVFDLHLLQFEEDLEIEPDRQFSPGSAYITVDTFSIKLREIPSEASTPTLSSLKLSSEPDDMRSVVQIPSVVPSKVVGGS